MIDHAQRIADKNEIERMACKIRPILYMIVICLVVIGVNSLLSSYARYKHADQIHTAKMFTYALNGRLIQMGDDVIKCTVTESKLVKGMK